MSLRPLAGYHVPEETARVARACTGYLATWLGRSHFFDTLNAIVQDCGHRGAK